MTRFERNRAEVYLNLFISVCACLTGIFNLNSGNHITSAIWFILTGAWGVRSLWSASSPIIIITRDELLLNSDIFKGFKKINLYEIEGISHINNKLFIDSQNGDRTKVKLKWIHHEQRQEFKDNVDLIIKNVD